MNSQGISVLSNKIRYQHGFTLIEVMIALLIMAMIAVASGQAFHTASSGASATRKAMERLAKIDRAFVLIENDLRNALAVERRTDGGRGASLSPMYVSGSEEYWMTVLRGGVANPLHQSRTEEVRVGYRFIDQELWRDTWYNPTSMEQEEARQRKILTGVETLSVKVLSPRASSLASTWLLGWPTSNSQGALMLPLAIELKVELADMGEVTRVFPILSGVSNEVVESASSTSSSSSAGSSSSSSSGGE